MIDLSVLVEKINEGLNNIAGSEVFKIYADGEKFESAILERNRIKNNYIQGVASVYNSSIIPTNGILIETFSVSTEIIIPLNTDRAVVIDEETNTITMEEQTFNDVISPVKDVLSEFASNTYTNTIVSGDKTYIVSYTVTQPKAGQITYRDGVGYSIPFSFYTNFAVIQNGINSKDFVLKFENEIVPFTQLNIIRSSVMDSGAFAQTGGIAKNYLSANALQITLTVPALTNTKITNEHFKYLVTGTPKEYDVTLTIPKPILDAGNDVATITGLYKMLFADCNASAKELDNVGQSITLVESLGV